MAKKIEKTDNRAGRGTGRAGAQEFQPDYGYVRADLRRIAILAAAFLSLLVLLSFVLD